MSAASGRRPGAPGICGLGFLLVLAALGLARPVEAQVYRPDTFKLANGLEVVVVDNPRVPAVAVMVWYRAGPPTSRSARAASRISSNT